MEWRECSAAEKKQVMKVEEERVANDVSERGWCLMVVVFMPGKAHWKAWVYSKSTSCSFSYYQLLMKGSCRNILERRLKQREIIDCIKNNQTYRKAQMKELTVTYALCTKK